MFQSCLSSRLFYTFVAKVGKIRQRNGNWKWNEKTETKALIVCTGGAPYFLFYIVLQAIDLFFWFASRHQRQIPAHAVSMKPTRSGRQVRRLWHLQPLGYAEELKRLHNFMHNHRWAHALSPSSPLPWTQSFTKRHRRVIKRGTVQMKWCTLQVMLT